MQSPQSFALWNVIRTMPDEIPAALRSAGRLHILFTIFDGDLKAWRIYHDVEVITEMPPSLESSKRSSSDTPPFCINFGRSMAYFNVWMSRRIESDRRPDNPSHPPITSCVSDERHREPQPLSFVKSFWRTPQRHG